MLKLISLNIERSRHYDRWIPWVQGEKPDVLCLQELPEEDIPMVEAQTGLKLCVFVPLTKVALSPEGRTNMVMGQAILAQVPAEHTHSLKYYGQGTGREVFDDTTAQGKVATSAYYVAVAEIGLGGSLYRIATTHFVWTPNGQSDEHQRIACTNLLNVLEDVGDIILCGDFNAPRGRDIFTRLAARYTDNIPLQYVCSLDKTLHRAGDKLDDLMVDGLFTTPAYRASNVSLKAGVSDHMGIVATLSHS